MSPSDFLPGAASTAPLRRTASYRATIQPSPRQRSSSPPIAASTRASARLLGRALALAALMCCLAACNERPADLREWKATDHDHTESPNSGQVQVDPAASAAPKIPGLDDVTIVAWQQNCTQCHGQVGRGDGPRGPMLKATNLSDPAWQAAATDEQIARVIKEGKGAMPPFKLPDGTIANLVKLVRMMNAAKLGAPAAPSAAAPSAAAPSAAAAATPSGARSARPAGPASEKPASHGAETNGPAAPKAAAPAVPPAPAAP